MTDMTGPTVRRRGRPPKALAGDTKAKLLRAALALFAAHGYEGTSVRAIARSVGMSESVLYAHFDSKREIFEAVLRQLGPLSAISALDDTDPALAADPAAFIRALTGRLVADWSAPPSRQLISLMSRDDLIHDPSLMAGIRASIGKLAARFAGWADAGQVRADLGAPDDLAYALISPIALARLLWLHNGAKRAEIATASERCVRHAEFFIGAVFPDR